MENFPLLPLLYKNPDTETIGISEGYATSATLFETINIPVACAFGAGNLEATAEAIREKYPDKSIVVFADNDETGLAKATAAAHVIKARLVVPPEPGDFNDLAASHGPRVVLDAYSPQSWCESQAAQIAGHPGFYIVKAPQAAGKTEKIIKPLVQTANHALVVTHRVALVRDVTNRLGIENYQDIHHDEHPYVNSLGCCLPSVRKFITTPAIHHCELLAIDEATQVAAELGNLEPNKQPAENHKVLIDTARQTLARGGTVLLADADFTDEWVALFENAIGAQAMVLEYAANESHRSVTVVSKGDIYDTLVADLKNPDCNVLVASGSRDFIKQLPPPSGDNSKVLHSGNTGDHKAFLGNPNAHIESVNNLLHSPVIAPGLNLTKGHFDRIYVYYSCRSITPAETIQMMRRWRPATEFIIIQSNAPAPNLPSTDKKIIKELIAVHKIDVDFERDENNHIRLEPFDNWRVQTQAINNAAKNTGINGLIALLTERGYRVTDERTGSRTTETMKANKLAYDEVMS